MIQKFDTLKLKDIPQSINQATLIVEAVGTSPQTITFVDKAGTVILKLQTTYGLTVLGPAKPTTEKKWTLRGQVQGLSVEEVFDSEWQAKDRKEDLSGRLNEDKFELKVSQEEVVVE